MQHDIRDGVWGRGDVDGDFEGFEDGFAFCEVGVCVRVEGEGEEGPGVVADKGEAAAGCGGIAEDGAVGVEVEGGHWGC